MARQLGAVLAIALLSGIFPIVSLLACNKSSYESIPAPNSA